MKLAITYNNSVKIFRLHMDKADLIFERKEDRMYDPQIVLSPNANYLMTSSGRRSNIWNVSADSLEYKRDNLTYSMGIGMFSQDEQYATIGAEFINLKDHRTVRTFSNNINYMKFSPDLGFVASDVGGSKAWLLRDIDFYNDDSKSGMLGGHNDFINHLTFSPDSTHLLTSSIDRSIKLWNTQISAAKKIYETGHLQGTFSTPDATLVAISNKANLTFFDAKGNFSHRHSLPVDSILNLSSDGKYIFANGEEKESIEIWSLDVVNKKTDYRFGIRGNDPVKMVDFFSDERVAFFASTNVMFSLQLWDFETGDSDYLSGYDSSLRAIRCSPDNRHLVAINNYGQIYLWETLKGKEARLLKKWPSGHAFGCRNINFSADGLNIYSAGNDNVAIVWDLEGNQVMRLADHIRPVLDVAQSPDQEYLVTSSEDRTAKIWNAAGELIVNLEGYNSLVTRARFSSDGQYIITNYKDGTIMIWPFNPKLIIDYMDDFDMPDLSEEEKMKYDLGE